VTVDQGSKTLRNVFRFPMQKRRVGGVEQRALTERILLHLPGTVCVRRRLSPALRPSVPEGVRRG
jgi:hypothetical protein